MNLSANQTGAPTLTGQCGWRVVAAQSVDDLREHVASWDALAADCLEPNPFYESWMLLPAVRAFGQDESLIFIFVYKDSPGAPSSLCAFFPLQRTRSGKSPFAVLSLWKHLHCFLCVPLLRADTARECLHALFKWARTDRRGAMLMRWELVMADGPFAECFTDCLRPQKTVYLVESSHARAFWSRGPDAETYLQQAISSRGRQDYRRKRKHLSQLGDLRFRTLERGESEQPWVQQFLALEASGWKGEKKTALATRPIERDYFVQIARAAHRRGQFEMVGLFLDDRPIAMKCHFRSGDGSFLFKPTYDESLARYSPGALLELDHLEFCHQTSQTLWMDSCTAPDSFLYNRLWTGRRRIQTVSFSTGSFIGNLLMAGKPLLQALRQRLKKPAHTHADRADDPAVENESAA